MRIVKDECLDCAAPAYPCLGSSCPNRKRTHYYCDRCKDEFLPEALYQYDGEEVCGECILKDFKIIDS